MIASSRKAVAAIQVQAFICRGCGSMDLYALRPVEMPVQQIDGAEILVGTQQAPHR